MARYAGYSELSGIVDSNDRFIRGSQLLKTSRKRRIPTWVYDDKKVKELLLLVFPKLLTDPTQRKRAARWMQVIQLHYRCEKSIRETSEEMQEKIGTILTITRSISRASKGQPTSGQIRKIGTIKYRAIKPTGHGDRDKDPVGEPQSRLTL